MSRYLEPLNPLSRFYLEYAKSCFEDPSDLFVPVDYEALGKLLRVYGENWFENKRLLIDKLINFANMQSDRAFQKYLWVLIEKTVKDEEKAKIQVQNLYSFYMSSTSYLGKPKNIKGNELCAQIKSGKVDLDMSKGEVVKDIFLRLSLAVSNRPFCEVCNGDLLYRVFTDRKCPICEKYVCKYHYDNGACHKK